MLGVILNFWEKYFDIESENNSIYFRDFSEWDFSEYNFYYASCWMRKFKFERPFKLEHPLSSIAILWRQILDKIRNYFPLFYISFVVLNSKLKPGQKMISWSTYRLWGTFRLWTPVYQVQEDGIHVSWGRSNEEEWIKSFWKKLLFFGIL